MDKEIFLNLLKERILILDGGMGTMVQGFKLTEKDYRGKQFADWTSDLKGNNDLLCITRPDVIKSIHRQYLDAGADIFATNTFNANAISMEDYGMQGQVRNINLAAGKLAREVADGFMKEHPDRTIFVAGSVGPTNKTASMSPDVSDPAYRAVTYLDLYSAYKEQVDALVDGGVDIALFETTFDTLNVKAGLEAAEAVLKEKGKDLPIMLSLTLSAQGGRTFSGQTLLAFLASVQHTNIVSVGLNCSFGAAVRILDRLNKIFFEGILETIFQFRKGIFFFGLFLVSTSLYAGESSLIFKDSSSFQIAQRQNPSSGKGNQRQSRHQKNGSQKTNRLS